jgi:hypothetical protein
MGEKRNAYRILVSKPEGNRTLERPRCRYVDNIKMGLREIGWVCMDWIDLAEDRDQWRGSCEHRNEHSGSINFWKFPEYLHNWRLLKKGSSIWSYGY